MSKNFSLNKAKSEKNDEFYTQYCDIEKELIHYKDKFVNKVVYCNCDDYTKSNFTKYFKDNFSELKLKKLVCTGLNSRYYEYDGENELIKDLVSNGDFRSEECIKFLKECDVVVTNPPFSLFRKYVDQLMECGKKFLIIGNKNAITYKEIFSYIKNNELWLGITNPDEYRLPNGNITQSVKGLCRWFTNLDNKKRNEELDLYRKYTKTDYPKYDNYDAIEVSKVSEIPMDYDGVMGVPITFLDKYCPSQFEILDGANRYLILDYFNINERIKLEHSHCCNVNGIAKYFRILIKRIIFRKKQKQ
jgi:hypothetical protein